MGQSGGGTTAALNAVERTRRQLEELDSLLHQLLELPVDPPTPPQPAKPQEKASAANAATAEAPPAASRPAWPEKPSSTSPPGARRVPPPPPASEPVILSAAELLQAHARDAAEATKPDLSLQAPPPRSRTGDEHGAEPMVVRRDAPEQDSTARPTYEATSPPPPDEEAGILEFRATLAPAAAPEPAAPAAPAEPRLPLSLRRVDPPHGGGLEAEPDWQSSEAWAFGARPLTETSYSADAERPSSLTRQALAARGTERRSLHDLLGWIGVIMFVAAVALGIGMWLGWTW